MEFQTFVQILSGFISILTLNNAGLLVSSKFLDAKHEKIVATVVSVWLWNFKDGGS